MKTLFKIAAVLLIAAMIVPQSAFARKMRPMEEMSTDPKLKPAYESYEKAVKLARAGDALYYKRPGEARQKYGNSESYCSDAIFKYKQLGHDNNIDVSHEVEVCERLMRDVHVQAGKLKTKIRFR